MCDVKTSDRSVGAEYSFEAECFVGQDVTLRQNVALEQNVRSNDVATDH